LADVDGDGLVDMAFSCPSTNRIGVYRNEGDGFFSEAVIGLPGYPGEEVTPSFVHVTDIDSDGYLELFAQSNSDRLFSHTLKFGNSSDAQNTTLTLQDPTVIAYGDFNYVSSSASPQGKRLWASLNTGRVVYITANRTERPFPHYLADAIKVKAANLLPYAYPSSSPTPSPSPSSTGDLTQLFISGTHSLSYSIVDMSDPEHFVFSPLIALNPDAFDYTISDVNRDGLFDIVSLGKIPIGAKYKTTLLISLNNGSRFFTYLLKDIDTSAEDGYHGVRGKVSSGDLNGDGFSDIAVFLYTGRIFILLNVNGTFPNLCEIDFGETARFSFLESGDGFFLADVNNDRFFDIVLPNNFTILMNEKGVGISSSTPPPPSPPSPAPIWGGFFAIPVFVIIPCVAIILAAYFCRRDKLRQQKKRQRAHHVDLRDVLSDSESGHGGDRHRAHMDVASTSSSSFEESETGRGVTPKEKRKEIPDAEKCVVCYRRRASTVFIGCGHSPCCLKCAKELNFCPICREQVIGIEEVHKGEKNIEEDKEEKKDQAGAGMSRQ